MTRYETFIRRQFKYTNRRRHLVTHNAKLSKPPAEPHHGGGKRWEREEGTLQKGHGVKHAPLYPGPRDWEALPLFIFTVSEITQTSPTHIKITDAAYLFFRSRGNSLKFKAVGYHRRRARWIGRKIGRMNGHQRQIMGATWMGLTQGCYPDWDPLERHPTVQEVAAGAPREYIDDWRWGVTGDYPS